MPETAWPNAGDHDILREFGLSPYEIRQSLRALTALSFRRVLLHTCGSRGRWPSNPKAEEPERIRAMTRVLIPTFPHDAHAVEVALALRDQGHEAVLWHGTDFPARQRASISIDGEGISWQAAGPELDLGGSFEVVWFRRPTPPVLPDDLHPGDRPVAERECEHFVSGLWHLVAPEAFWVNPLASRSRSRLKAVQLREAARVGLAVPPTLMSNDPERIREFLEKLPGKAIFKSFCPAQWEGDNLVALLLTSEVSVEDLPEDDVLRLTPGIFQPKLPKAHELRVTYMGGHMVTARLLSQRSAATRLDWRAASAGLEVEAATLPHPIEQACRRLMERLGLVFGCFDFIVTPEGEHVFLEVNPMGQFLWVEQANPRLRLLDPFCEFLVGGRSDFRFEQRSGGVHHQDYYQAAMDLIEASAPLHVPDTERFVSSDLPAAGEKTAAGTS